MNRLARTMILVAGGAALAAGPGCRRSADASPPARHAVDVEADTIGEDAAPAPSDAVEQGDAGRAAAADAEELPPLYGDLVSSSSPSSSVQYRTRYMPPAAELEPAEREALRAEIAERIDDIQRCYDGLDPRQHGLAWDGIVRIVAPPGGPLQVGTTGSGQAAAERCVREAAERFRLLPSELSTSRTLEIPIRLEPAP